VLLRLNFYRRLLFFVPNALVKNLPDQTTEAVGDRTDGLRVPEARDEVAIDEAKMLPFAFTAALAAGSAHDASDGCPGNTCRR
jgi:hypothetical protein